MTTRTTQSIFAFPTAEQASAAFVQTVQLLNQNEDGFAAAALLVKEQNGRLTLQGVSPTLVQYQARHDSFVARLIDMCTRSQSVRPDPTPQSPQAYLGIPLAKSSCQDNCIPADIMEQDVAIIVQASSPVLEQLTAMLTAFSASVVA